MRRSAVMYEVLAAIEQPGVDGISGSEVLRPRMKVSHSKLRKWGQSDEAIADLVKQKAIKEAK